jgi:hypothetical protein
MMMTPSECLGHNAQMPSARCSSQQLMTSSKNDWMLIAAKSVQRSHMRTTIPAACSSREQEGQPASCIAEASTRDTPNINTACFFF